MPMVSLTFRVHYLVRALFLACRDREKNAAYVLLIEWKFSFTNRLSCEAIIPTFFTRPPHIREIKRGFQIPQKTVFMHHVSKENFEQRENENTFSSR